jgi:hypothetical protein
MNHLFIGERKRSEPALPTRSPMARVRKEIDTFTIPEGRRQQVYQPCDKSWRTAERRVNSNAVVRPIIPSPESGRTIDDDEIAD